MESEPRDAPSGGRVDNHERADVGSARAIALDLYMRHGTTTYSLARLLANDEDGAVSLAAQAILDACGRRAPGADQRRLARRVYVLDARTRTTRGRLDDRPESHERGQSLTGSSPSPTLNRDEESALGLALFGQLRYREVADLMGISPQKSAELMLSGLRALARASGLDPNGESRLGIR